MSKDRELLELAAKAAGYAGASWFKDSLLVPHATENRRVSWNPLTDDGDALRLAVKLNIQLAPDEWNSMATAFVVNEDCDPREETICVELWGADKSAATRRAIVRAAAALANKE